jgi:hypothetical protein
MATKEFNTKQKEIVARRLGYDGPMQGFDEFLRSDPAMQRKYGLVADKYMSKGGMIRKYQTGGTVTSSGNFGFTPPPQGTPTTSVMVPYYNTKTGETWTAPSGGYTPPSADWVQGNLPTGFTPTTGTTGGSVTPPTSPGTNPVSFAPVKPTAAQVTPALTTEQAGQIVNTQLAPLTATQIAPTAPVTAATAAAPTVAPTATTTAATVSPAVQAATAALQPAQGAVSQQAQVQAQTMEPTTTSVSALQAAQGTANQVAGAPTRVAQAGEMISGAAVDSAQVAQALQQNQAAQGVVTDPMTVQGQLNNLLTNFQTNNPPSWAAASLRNATTVMAQRGLGASSLAGQAIIQATLEAAIPIASADAETYKQMGLQNLSNRQQIAVLTAQQRAQFLGQEFDQAFQTRVVNAARVADIANLNFNAQQQVALENARLAQTMDLANLTNRQSLVMAEAAQIANLETANLNNRQQAAVTNAKSFLEMDLTNLSYRQQTELFKSQQNIQSLFTDAAAENASRQFNATSENQTNQFFSTLATQVSTFNATQTNAMSQFNANQAATIAKFNAETQNQRDQFNAQSRLVIDQSNAQWRREIATANTAATNRANEFNATKAMELTTIEYNNLWQLYRDHIEYAWKSGENDQDRINQISRAEIAANATVIAATLAKDAETSKAIGSAVGKVLGDIDIGDAIGDIFDWGSDVVSEVGDWIGGLF